MTDAVAAFSVPLVCHPASPSTAVRAVQVHAQWRAGGRLALDYVLDGDPRALRLPDPAAPARVDGLWRHTCCELFAAAPEHTAYRELNFSPSGEWAAYAFSTCRERGPDPAVCAPRIEARRHPQGFALIVLLDADALPAAPGGVLQLGLSVVVEAVDGGLSYWALRHPAARPDFHHRDAFAQDLPLPRAENPAPPSTFTADPTTQSETRP